MWSVERESRTCHRCDAELYLSVRLPHPDSPTGPGAIGHVRVATLCPRCDVDNAAAHALLAFFAVHGAVDGANAGEFAALVHDWVDALPPPPEVDLDALEDEIEAWRRGEL